MSLPASENLHGPQSLDAPPLGWGPGLLKLTSWPYRVEMGVGALALLAILLGWTPVVVGSVSVLKTVFWFLWPDLFAFLPIGVASRGQAAWPRWGAGAYNLVHTFLVWGALFVVWGVVSGAPYWPLKGWALHIAMDRAAGYYLRAPGGSERDVP